MKVYIFISLILIIPFLSVEAKLDRSKKRFIVQYQTEQDRLQENATSSNKNSSSLVRQAIIEIPEENVEEFFKDIENSPDILSIEEDRILTHQSINEDSYHGGYLWGLTDSLSGIDSAQAWEEVTGTTNTVVAVIDSGITAHPDLAGVLLPGADFVTDIFMSNDGSGRDSDPTDPGNWVNENDCYTGSPAQPSSWHGTHVAGIVGSIAGNGSGIVGAAHGVSILPVRALGKCGGFISDIADAIIWSVGGRINGLPLNQNPADVINLSIGGIGNCSSTMQNAINFARSKGAVVVVASGNERLNLDITAYTPVSCKGVINVAAYGENREFASYSNFGREVDVVAPGGGNSGRGILSLSNAGETTIGSPTLSYKFGTSMAAPFVSAIAALINETNGSLYPDQVEQIIKDTSLLMNAIGSGYGQVNAHEAVLLASRTSPDSSYKGEEVYLNRQTASTNSGGSRFVGSEEEIAACGSITNIDGGSGPRNGLGSFLLSILLGFIAVHLSKKSHGFKS